MEKYDYYRAVTDAIKDWIISNDVDLTDEDVEDSIFDDVFNEDSVTGNGYAYFDTEDKCSEYLSGNFNILYDAIREYCIDDCELILIEHYEDKSLARYFDCTIRCYILGECISMAIKELKGENYE